MTYYIGSRLVGFEIIFHKKFYYSQNMFINIRTTNMYRDVKIYSLQIYILQDTSLL